MNPIKLFYHVGQYWLMLRQVFRRPEKRNVFWSRFLMRLIQLGLAHLELLPSFLFLWVL